MKSPIYFVILIFESVIYYCKLLINKSLVFLVSGSFHLKAPISENILLNCSFLFSLVFANIHYTSAQTPWTLQQCLDHAMQQNTQIAMRQFDVQIAEINRKQSNMAFLPSVNGGATHGYNWGQSIDPFTNQFASNRVQTNNFYLSGNWTLFNGFQNYRLMQIAKLDEYASQLNAEVERRNVKMSVTGAYLQSVLNYQMVAIQEKRMSFTKEQRDRLGLMYENKATTQLEYLELVAQFALDSSEYLRLLGEYRISINQLKQILNIQVTENFDIDLNPSINAHLIQFDQNKLQTPEVDALDVQNEITNMRIDNAKSRLVPTLSVNGSLGTGYSGNNQQLVNGNLQAKPLPVQMQENFYQSAVLNLSIPIFNQGNVNSEIQRNKIEQQRISQQRIELVNDLNYKIEQLKIEITTLQIQIESLKISQSAAQTAFDVAKLKFEAGNIKLIDFLEVQNRLFQTESQLTQAQFQLYFKTEILRMYY